MSKKHVRISPEHLEMLRELAEMDNRSMTNYLETLVGREYVTRKLGLEFTGVEPVEGE